MVAQNIVMTVLNVMVVFICVIISWLVTLPGLFGPLSNTWNQILWWVELIFNIATLVFCVLASFYYSRLNTRPHD